MKRDERITVRLEQGLRKRLAVFAGSRNRKESEVIREALERYLDKQRPVPREESAFDIAVRCGLIGCYPDAPPGLSTDPKYMEGFGQNGR